MGILGIPNRTENWKTAESFAPFFEDCSARIRLVDRLLKPLGNPDRAQGNAIKIELFWKGVRDYINQSENENELEECLVARYSCLFPYLREELKGFPGFQLKWNNSHYSVHSNRKKLFNNRN